MLAKDLTFGVEIETSLPRSVYDSFRTGPYHRGNGIHEAPRGWNSQSDRSLSANSADYFTAEVVSPVLKGENGLVELFYMAQYLESVGAQFNATMGTHVHVSAANFNQARLEKLAKLFREHEAAFVAISGELAVNRLRSTYCKMSYGWDSLLGTGRYRSLNFQNMQTSKRTVEFRLFAPTCDPSQLTTMVYMAVSLVSYVSQMTDAEVNGTTRYPRPKSFTQAVNDFTGLVWRDPAHFIVPNEDVNELKAVLRHHASLVPDHVQNAYKLALIRRYGRNYSQSERMDIMAQFAQQDQSLVALI